MSKGVPRCRRGKRSANKRGILINFPYLSAVLDKKILGNCPMASRFRSLSFQAGVASATMFALGVLTTGIIAYGNMSETLERNHAEMLTAASNDGLSVLKGVG